MYTHTFCIMISLHFYTALISLRERAIGNIPNLESKIYKFSLLDNSNNNNIYKCSSTSDG